MSQKKSPTKLKKKIKVNAVVDEILNSEQIAGRQ